MIALNDLIYVNPFARLNEILDDDVTVQKVSARLIVKTSFAKSPQTHYARYLDEKDIGRIQQCIRVLVVQSIIPWMEARVREWNETFELNRNGMTSNLFEASKKFFGSVKTGNPIMSGRRLGYGDPYVKAFSRDDTD